MWMNSLLHQILEALNILKRDYPFPKILNENLYQTKILKFGNTFQFYKMFLGRLPIKEHLKTSCKEQATFVTIFFQEFILLFFTSEIELIAFLISESIPKISTVFVLYSMIISIQLFFQSAVVLIAFQLADWLSIKLLHYRTKRNKLFR